MREIEQTVKIEIDDTKLDEITKKANRLVELLQEVQRIVDSLSENKKLKA